MLVFIGVFLSSGEGFFFIKSHVTNLFSIHVKVYALGGSSFRRTCAQINLHLFYYIADSFSSRSICFWRVYLTSPLSINGEVENSPALRANEE